MKKDGFEYFAFISYKREDEKWAKWLQKKLESYNLPATIRKSHPNLPQKIRPVFRDETDLSGGNLKTAIEQGLNGSKYLLLICSPRSAKSPWVSKEVRHFIDNGREKYIIPFIISGTPKSANPEDECFPEGLRALTEEKEILGININEMGRDAAAIKVIATMFGLRFDSLWQRQERDKNRKRFLIIVLMAVFSLLSIVISTIIINQNRKLGEANKAILSERKKVMDTNEALTEAYDSIKYQSNLLVLSNDSLNLINDVLAATIRNLDIERNNVVKKSHELQKEQLRLVSSQAEALFEAGDVLRSFQLIRPMAIEIVNHRYPYSPEVASLINKIRWHLGAEGYKVIERLSESDGSPPFVSPDLLYNPYTEEGKFYLRDIKNGRTHLLPGEYDPYFYDIQFSGDTLYYRGARDSYMWNLVKAEKINIPKSHKYASMNYEEYCVQDSYPGFYYPATYKIESFRDIPDIIDYNIREIVVRDSGYLVSPDSSEIIVDKKLLSRRTLPMSSLYSTKKSNIRKKKYVTQKHYRLPDSIIYNNRTWYKIDEKGPLKLYEWKDVGTYDKHLLFVDNRHHSVFEFIPFVTYSMGNGIGYLSNAFILNEDEILCVSGQTNHEIFNTKLNTKYDFQWGNIDGWKMGHVGLYLADAFLLNENTLCDVRYNGQITLYDIPTRLVIDEYDIPFGGWLKNSELVNHTYHDGNNIVMAYDDCNYEIELTDRVQSLSEDIFLIDQFWK